MNLTYNSCKKVIANGTYGTKEEMLWKLDVFLLNNRITETQYTELVEQLEAKELEGASQ